MRKMMVDSQILDSLVLSDIRTTVYEKAQLNLTQTPFNARRQNLS
jgi:hypothetical protein